VILRFCLYSIFKNLRFADPFLLLFLLHIDSSYTAIGLLLGFGAITTAILEVPSGVLADHWGRVRSVAACFLAYAVSFGIFPEAANSDGTTRTIWLYAAVACFSVGEALRTGGHKAIMLDWLDSDGREHSTTRIIGMTRAWSKYTTGFAALAGGLILYLTTDYSWLFYMSAVAAVGGFVLMLTYPGDLEGERTRRRRAERNRSKLQDTAPTEREGFVARFRDSVSNQGFSQLFVESVAFESQAKIMLKYYLQPWLKIALESSGMAILGVGALSVGVYELIRNAIGGFGALLSERLERLIGGTGRALRVAYLGALSISVALVVCLWQGWFLAGLVLMIAVSVLQNARRPVFLHAFNEVMDKDSRATTLSIESQARSLVTAALLPATGWLADQYGLIAVFVTISCVLAVGLVLGKALQRQTQPVGPA